LTNPETHQQPVSATFHGRDIFAPVAAHLARGVPLKDLGPQVTDPVTWSATKPQRLDEGQVAAEIAYIDRFGNLVTNLRLFAKGQVPKDPAFIRIVVDGRTIPFHRTYADVPEGELVALVGSSGYLEIAVRNGNAAERLDVGIGTRVEVWGL
jgi:S-adenosylmethionine hydrolase